MYSAVHSQNSSRNSLKTNTKETHTTAIIIQPTIQSQEGSLLLKGKKTTKYSSKQKKFTSQWQSEWPVQQHRQQQEQENIHLTLTTIQLPRPPLSAVQSAVSITVVAGKNMLPRLHPIVAQIPGSLLGPSSAMRPRIQPVLLSEQTRPAIEPGRCNQIQRWQWVYLKIYFCSYSAYSVCTAMFLFGLSLFLELENFNLISSFTLKLD